MQTFSNKIAIAIVIPFIYNIPVHRRKDFMKLSFRWYGLTDSIPLTYIRQIPNMYSVVTSVYDKKPGEVCLL